MGKVTPKKLTSQPAGPLQKKSSKFLGAQKQKPPKSEMKLKAVVQSDLVAPSKKKTKKILPSGMFEVTEISEDAGSKAGKKQKIKKEKWQSVKIKIEPESPQVSKKADEEAVGNKSADLPKKSKNKKKSGSEPDTTGKKKLLDVASATTSQPFKVQNKIKLQQVSESTEEGSKRGKKRKNKKAAGETSEESDSPKKMKTADDPENGKKRKTRRSKKKDTHSAYTLFVGNLHYETTAEEIEAHFTKADVKPLRVNLPKDKITNMPRGFAFVDVADNDQYIKALNLNNTFIRKRQLRVQFTMSGRKSDHRTKTIKKKNLKFQALRKMGIPLNKAMDKVKEAETAGDKSQADEAKTAE